MHLVDDVKASLNQREKARTGKNSDEDGNEPDDTGCGREFVEDSAYHVCRRKWRREDFFDLQDEKLPGTWE